MTREEAGKLVAMVASVWPTNSKFDTFGDAEAAAMARFLVDLQDFPAAREAVMYLGKHQKYRPTVSEILGQYRQEKKRATELGLPESTWRPPGDEERRRTSEWITRAREELRGG